MNSPWTHRVLFGAFLTSAVTFSISFAMLIGQLQDWSIIWEPPTVSKMILTVFVPALVSFGSALGLSVPKMFNNNGDGK